MAAFVRDALPCHWDILEAGPPRNVKAALERFRKTIDDNRKAAEELARSLGFSLD